MTLLLPCRDITEGNSTKNVNRSADTDTELTAKLIQNWYRTDSQIRIASHGSPPKVTPQNTAVYFELDNNFRGLE